MCKLLTCTNCAGLGLTFRMAISLLLFRLVPLEQQALYMQRDNFELYPFGPTTHCLHDTMTTSHLQTGKVTGKNELIQPGRRGIDVYSIFNIYYVQGTNYTYTIPDQTLVRFSRKRLNHFVKELFWIHEIIKGITFTIFRFLLSIYLHNCFAKISVHHLVPRILY